MRQLKYIIPVVLVLALILWITIPLEEKECASCMPDTEAEKHPSFPDTLRLLFAGDVMVHELQLQAARFEGGDSTYNFHPPFSFLRSYVRSADLAMANLELTLGKGPYSGYPLFSSPSTIIDALKDTGFRIFFTANNHSVDAGTKGIEGTIDYLHASALFHTGSFKNSLEREAHYPLIVEKNNIRLALLNYTYGTNGMPVRPPNIINIIDTLQIRQDLETATRKQPDYIIACMHWGYEYHSRENSEQRRLARFLADNGADLIIGSHPHVVQPYEEITSSAGKTVPVIYSLGNFISNQRKRGTDGGIIFETILVKEEGKTRRIVSAYEPVWVYRFSESGHTLSRLIPINDYWRDSTRYQLNEEERSALQQFFDVTRQTLPNLPFSGFYQ